jgi:hypothetical protein
MCSGRQIRFSRFPVWIIRICTFFSSINTYICTVCNISVVIVVVSLLMSASDVCASSGIVVGPFSTTVVLSASLFSDAGFVLTSAVLDLPADPNIF